MDKLLDFLDQLDETEAEAPLDRELSRLEDEVGEMGEMVEDHHELPMAERQLCASYLLHDDNLDLIYISELESRMQALQLENDLLKSRVQSLEQRLHPMLGEAV